MYICTYVCMYVKSYQNGPIVYISRYAVILQKLHQELRNKEI